MQNGFLPVDICNPEGSISEHHPKSEATGRKSDRVCTSDMLSGETSIAKNWSLYFGSSFAEGILRTVTDLFKGRSHTDIVLSSLFSLYTIIA